MHTKMCNLLIAVDLRTFRLRKNNIKDGLMNARRDSIDRYTCIYTKSCAFLPLYRICRNFVHNVYISYWVMVYLFMFDRTSDCEKLYIRNVAASTLMVVCLVEEVNNIDPCAFKQYFRVIYHIDCYIGM